jgi:hypothetical protein
LKTASERWRSIIVTSTTSQLSYSPSVSSFSCGLSPSANYL